MSERHARRTARPLAALILTGGLLLSTTVPAAADEEEFPGGPPERPEGQPSTEEFIYAPDAEDFTQRYDATDFIDELGGDSEEDDVIVLETDILFSAMEWEIPSGAGSTIAGLMDDVPEGATVQVHGHTDSNPVPEEYDFDNQVLSENRAEAVAEVLEQERSDLTLEVEGFGDSEPAVTEDPEDPSTYAANRRVEIRYGD
ncbi:OmpA family protein [Nesterenkonia lacusekhoensis]|uniref:Outer membrane protein OmpA-like peptidoglycan-associated protein n=1 Tax=Nesterenkonia lacusekhoensis TaxID=150832 RepID=A0ABS4T457_9MICC|nr:OmpA family protein [Nesterenkonia lacusekhoensis]MBP2318653.1 outer membrane protein OmpA-like peptidoglycan-associated protein [Nesterenkonia lacusekhoensis]